MTVYTYSEARQKLASLLDEARREGAVQIRRRDGTTFTVTLTRPQGSPLDVPGVDVGLSREEIVDLVRQGRERTYGDGTSG